MKITGLSSSVAAATLMLLFNGLGRASIRAACEAFLEKVAKAWDQWLKTCVAPVRKQEDSWSCGHRTLAAVRHVLVHCKSHWPLNIPVEVFSHEQLASLCDEEKPKPKIADQAHARARARSPAHSSRRRSRSRGHARRPGARTAQTRQRRAQVQGH